MFKCRSYCLPELVGSMFQINAGFAGNHDRYIAIRSADRVKNRDRLELGLGPV